MNLEETLRKMKENEKTFYSLVEGMKRRADKGLLEGVTSEDIDYYVNKIETDTVVVEDHININQEIFELNEAIEKFDYMDLDSWSEEELEAGILYEFLNDISLMEESDYYDEYDNNERRKRNIRRAHLIGIGGLGTVGATHIFRKKGNDSIEAAANKAKDDALAKLPSTATLAQSNEVGTSAYNAVKNAAANKHPGWKGFSDTAQNIHNGLKAGWKGITTWAAANPWLAGAGLGAAAVGIGIGAYKLIKHLRKKKQEKNLTEGVYTDDLLFTNETKFLIQEMINTLSIEDLEYLKENATEDTKEILSLFEKQPEVLDEAVTFIDNAGNLKTMSTPDYVKDQHEYHTETQITKYEKKKKKRDYKLISEEIDIDNIKKLSEMSLEDILNEEWDS